MRVFSQFPLLLGGFNISRRSVHTSTFTLLLIRRFCVMQTAKFRQLHFDRLKRQDYKTVLDVIDIAYSGRNRTEMLEAVLRKLEGIIGVSSAAFVPWNPDAQQFRLDGNAVINSSSDVLALYLKHYATCDPYLGTQSHLTIAMNQAVKITDFISVSRYKETQYARELAPLIPCFYEMNVTLNCRQRILGGLALHRTRRERDFGERDREILTLIAPHLARALYNLELGAPQGPSIGSSHLSPRQTEIARLVSHGLSNREIAERLFIAEQTVKDHLRSVFEKLKVKRRTQLLASLKPESLSQTVF